ncbi:MAG: DUF4358 domain-containing protein [Agathobacter sp.]|nr:DUF4358 domain-containing protein [Agathobacter sp.]
MKKIWTMLLAVVLAVGVFGACGSDELGNEPDVKAVAQALQDGIQFEETLNELPQDEIGYYITLADGVSGVMYISTGNTAEEVAVFEAPDKDAAATMLTNIKEYLQAQRSSFADYLPEEAKRIDDALVVQKGRYAVLCVSAQTDTAKQIVEDQFK